MAVFYDQHETSLQRAYQIVCFLIGADPVKFKYLGDVTKLPASREQSCKYDYSSAARSWETALAPYRRSADNAQTRIDVIYSPGKDALEKYASAFKELKFLERIAAMASDKFVWRSPFKMEMRSCGHVNAYWSVKDREVIVCYELVGEFVDLFVQFASDTVIEKRMDSLIPPKNRDEKILPRAKADAR